MDDLTHAFQVLGLKPGASPEEVKQAYRDMVRVWHPDRFGHDERLRLIAQDKLKEINGAYRVLEAHFFAAGAAPETTAPDEPKPSAEASATNDAPQTNHNRVVFWAALGTMLVVLAVGSVWLLKRAAAPAQEPAAARYALSFDGDGSRVAIATTGSLTGEYTVECWAFDPPPQRHGNHFEFARAGGFQLRYQIPGREAISRRHRRRITLARQDGQRVLQIQSEHLVSHRLRRDSHELPHLCQRRAAGKQFDLPGGKSPALRQQPSTVPGPDGIDQDGFDGSIAEVRVWKTARTAGEIKSNMTVSLTGSEPDLQGYWRFDEGSGSTTADGSGHGFSGTLIGSISWTTNTPPISFEAPPPRTALGSSRANH